METKKEDVWIFGYKIRCSSPDITELRKAIPKLVSTRTTGLFQIDVFSKEELSKREMAELDERMASIFNSSKDITTIKREKFELGDSEYKERKTVPWLAKIKALDDA